MATELLCPAGGLETLRYALMGGADAVYFGTKEFNARMNARNMERDEVLRAVSLCHDKGVRAYVTLNTLMTDRLLPRALDTAAFLYEAGVDALILADLGLARAIRENFPDFELHASTQLSGHSAAAAAFFQKAGFSRMVAAREMDEKNVKLLCKTSPIETEFFVHGAICASASGQCLMSSMIGGRSGNRGECAQPCRLPYNGAYPLSFKDLCLAAHLPRLVEAGVASLKIEGRMKGPDYVYTVASIWRRLLDENRPATKKELEALAGVFSRSGFTDGYFTGKKNSSMLGRRTEDDKKKTAVQKISYRERERGLPPIPLSRKKKEYASPSLPPKEKGSFTRSARFASAAQIPETDYFHIRYLPLFAFDGSVANGAVLPPVIFDSEMAAVRERLEQAVAEGCEHLLVGNAGHFTLAEGLNLILHGDFRLNVTNSTAAGEYPTLSDLILSPELGLAQMRDLRAKKAAVIYGRLPLMLLEKDPEAKLLRDRRGAAFPVLREGGRFVLYNCVPHYMLDKKRELKDAGITSHHWIFTTETKKDVLSLIQSAKEGKSASFPIKRI